MILPISPTYLSKRLRNWNNKINKVELGTNNLKSSATCWRFLVLQWIREKFRKLRLSTLSASRKWNHRRCSHCSWDTGRCAYRGVGHRSCCDRKDQEPELEIFPGAVTVRMLRHLSDSWESFLESQVSLCWSVYIFSVQLYTKYLLMRVWLSMQIWLLGLWNINCCRADSAS